MKTAAEIITYLEAELAEAYETHNLEKGNDDKTKAFTSLVKIVVLEQILEDVK